MANFSIWIPYCDSHCPALLDLFISADTSICSTMIFTLLGKSDHCIAYDYSSSDWDDPRDHLRNVPWEDIFKLGASVLLLVNFVNGFKVGIDVYIPHHKYQVKPHSSS